MKRRFCFIILLLLTFVLCSVTSDALENFTVRVIYFQPADVNDPNMPDLIRNRMADVHEFYADEMDRHGFGRKTFRIEKDATDKIVVHTINGKHNADHYGNAPKTHIAMQPELPAEFLNHKNANIFFIGGIRHYNNGTGGIALGVLFWGAGNNGGYALIPTRHMQFDVVVHELGHTFGLSHNKHRTEPDFVMGRNAGDDGFAHHEARWLDKSSYFNHNPQPIGILPTLRKIYPTTRVDNEITLNVDVESPNGVHQVEIARIADRAVIAWDYMNGQPKVNAKFNFEVVDLLGDRRVWYRMIDTQGAIRQNLKDIAIPSRPPQKNPIEPPKEPETEVADPEPKPDTKPEPEKVDPEPKPQPPRFVPTRRHITTSWARMKKRR